MTMQIHRALKLLKLRTFADLDDIQRLERNLLALEGAKGHRGPLTRLTLRVSFQKVLKQFASWCARNRRYLPNDPLAQWEFLTVPESLPRRRRRALSPAEMARALLAADVLDRLYNRQHATVTIWTGLLITGARFGALSAADVEQLDRERSRIDLGPGVGKKRRGTAALDAKTMTEFLAYVGERPTGPLLLSPMGDRLDRSNAIDDWRQAVSLGLVDELWPADRPRDMETMVLVTNVLLKDRVANVGGNPQQLRDETKQAREDRAKEVRALAASFAEIWEGRMQGVDIHALRKTHRTWAEASGVNPILIDKQLGHSTAAGAAALDMTRALLTSPTGRKHYVDIGLEIIDPRQSAEAVRKLLDSAREEILLGGRTVFAPEGELSLPPIIPFPATGRNREGQFHGRTRPGGHMGESTGRKRKKTAD
jgi:integrase